jgi:hypothetical protein
MVKAGTETNGVHCEKLGQGGGLVTVAFPPKKTPALQRCFRGPDSTRPIGCA